MKQIILTFLAVFFSCASFAQTTIAGDSVVCVGGTIPLLVTSGVVTTPGHWTSSNVLVATAGTMLGPTTTVTGVAPGSVTITYTAGTTILTKSVTVDAPPSAIAGTMSVCTGGTTTLTSSPTGGTWTSGTTTVATVGSSSGIVTGVVPGSATITYTLAPGCSVSTTVTVGGASPIVGPDSLCTSSTTTLSDATSGGTWSSSDPSVGTIDATGDVTGVSLGTTDIVYTPTGGCGPASMTMTIITTPAAITGPDVVCSGSTITLSDAGSGTWSCSLPIFAAIGATTGTVTGIATGVITVSYTLGAGCYATTPVTIDATATSYTVTGGGSYCAGGTGLTVSLSGSTSGVSYQLYLGGSPIGTAVTGTGSTLDWSETTAGTYTVEASGTCGGTMAGSATITVNPLPTIYTVTGGGSFCAGGTGITVGLSGSSSGISYQLYSGSSAIGAPVDGIGSSLSFGPLTSSGVYTIVATNSTTGCSNSMTGSATITVNPLPDPIAGTRIVCTGLTRAFTDATAGGTWSSSTVSIATVGSTGIVSGIAAGTDTIKYTLAATGCYSTAVVTVTPIPCSSTGIFEVSLAAGQVNIYPNPATDELTITINKNAYNSFTITNQLGEVLMKRRIDAVQTIIKVNQFVAGLYYIELEGSNGSTIQKFVKM